MEQQTHTSNGVETK